MLAAYIQMHFRLHFIMEANTMKPGQTVPCAHAEYKMRWAAESVNDTYLYVHFLGLKAEKALSSEIAQVCLSLRYLHMR